MLLDVHMPDGGGVAVLRRCATSCPAPRVLALSVSDAAEDVVPMIRAGALGYVTKTIASEELLTPSRRRRRRRRLLPAARRVRAPGLPRRRRRARRSDDPEVDS